MVWSHIFENKNTNVDKPVRNTRSQPFYVIHKYKVFSLIYQSLNIICFIDENNIL